MHILVYSKSDCPYCTRAKALLDKIGQSYETSVLDDVTDRNALYDRFGLVGGERTMPQIVLFDQPDTPERIGGYDALVAAVSEGRL